MDGRGMGTGFGWEGGEEMSKRMIRLYRRLKTWDMGIFFGTKVVKQWGEYLFNREGLIIYGFYEIDGSYSIFEGISGYLIGNKNTKEEAISDAKSALSKASADLIENIKAMAPYYGMSAMHIGPLNIVRDNTLLGDRKKQKRYRNRIGNIRCKDCDSLYSKCLSSEKSCCPDYHCSTRSKKMEV